MVPVERAGSLTAVVIIAGVIGAVVFASLAARMGPAIQACQEASPQRPRAADLGASPPVDVTHHDRCPGVMTARTDCLTAEPDGRANSLTPTR